MMITKEKTYRIIHEIDVARTVIESTKLAKEIGFSANKQNAIGTVVSELGKNIINHATSGEITLSLITSGNIKGIEIHAKDKGPGIPDINKAFEESYSTKGSLGLGLPAVKRMTDELEIETEVGSGTLIKVRKWLSYGKN